MTTRPAARKTIAWKARGLTPEEIGLMSMVCSQTGVSVDHLGEMIGVGEKAAMEIAAGLSEQGLVEHGELLRGESPWVWMRPAGVRALGLSMRARCPELAALRHQYAINEARVRAMRVPGARWVSTRELCQGQYARRGWTPDGVVEVNGERHAIEVELSVKGEQYLRKKLAWLEERFDRVVYLVAPVVHRAMARWELPERHPLLILREIEVRSTGVDRREWMLEADIDVEIVRGAAPQAGDRGVLRLIAEQYAVRMSDLVGFLGEGEDAVESRLRRYVAAGWVRRAQPIPGESPWVWLTPRGTTVSGYGGTSPVPRLGAIGRLAAVNEVRLALCGSGAAGRWVSGRTLGRGRGKERVRPPAGMLEVAGERYAVDVLLSVPEKGKLRSRLEARRGEFDGMLWFCERRGWSPLVGFARSAGEERLRVMPLPGVDISGLRPGSGKGRARWGSGPRSAEEKLWARLRKGSPTRMEEVMPASLGREPTEAIEEECGKAGVEVTRAWRRIGKGMRVLRLETSAGIFRVVRSSWGWRASEVRDEGVFELIAGPPLDRSQRRPSTGKPKRRTRPRAVEGRWRPNARQRAVLERLQAEPGTWLDAAGAGEAGGVTTGLARMELLELASRRLLIGRVGPRRRVRFWASPDLNRRLGYLGLEELARGRDSDWRPPAEEWRGDRCLELLRVIWEQGAVEVGLLEQVTGLSRVALAEALVELWERRLVRSQEREGYAWPWVRVRRRGWGLVGGWCRDAATLERPAELWGEAAARARLAGVYPGAQWVPGLLVAVDARLGKGPYVPSAAVQMMGEDGLLRSRAVEVWPAAGGRSEEELVEAVRWYGSHYDGVDVVSAGDGSPVPAAVKGAGARVWKVGSVRPPRPGDEEWLARIRGLAPGDAVPAEEYPLRRYSGRCRVRWDGPCVVYGVDPAALPAAAVEAIAEALGDGADPRPLEAWKKDGGGTQIFCVRTASAELRLAGARQRWRADEVIGEGVFEKRPQRLAPKRKRLVDRGPKEVYEIAVEEFAAEGLEAVRVTAEAATAPRVTGVWQSFGGGAQIYCVETEMGTFRVVESHWGWRADRAGQKAFVKRPRRPRRLPELRGMPVYRLEAEAVPPQMPEALAAAAGRAPAVRSVWRRSRKPFVYCAVTDLGVFRVQQDGARRWRAELAGEDVFVREAGPMPGAEPGRLVVEPPRFEIDDETWARVAPYVPEPGGGRLHRGFIRFSNRAIVSGLLYVLRNELSSWGKLPAELGFGTQWSCPRRLARWEELGAWDELRSVLERELPDGSELDFSRLPSGRH